MFKNISIFFVFLSFALAGVMDVMDISKAGMKVQQQQLQALAENIANINTIKTVGGAEYKRKEVVIRTNQRTGEPYVARVIQKENNVEKIYDPGNPDADENGYVAVPDISVSKEMVDISLIKRMYEANSAVFSSAKQMAQTVMNLGK
jgi:flagellar basal-body rod protein FlgC